MIWDDVKRSTKLLLNPSLQVLFDEVLHSVHTRALQGCQDSGLTSVIIMTFGVLKHSVLR